MVYLVWKQRQRGVKEAHLEITYHSKLLFTLCTVFETPDRRSGGLI